MTFPGFQDRSSCISQTSRWWWSWLRGRMDWYVRMRIERTVRSLPKDNYGLIRSKSCPLRRSASLQNLTAPNTDCRKQFSSLFSKFRVLFDLRFGTRRFWRVARGTFYELTIFMILCDQNQSQRGLIVAPVKSHFQNNWRKVVDDSDHA